jgi:hypothetical protein
MNQIYNFKFIGKSPNHFVNSFPKFSLAGSLLLDVTSLFCTLPSVWVISVPITILHCVCADCMAQSFCILHELSTHFGFHIYGAMLWSDILILANATFDITFYKPLVFMEQ